MTTFGQGANEPIRLSVHARGYLSRRGFSEAEVVDTIRSARWRSAREGRLEASKDFPYRSLWHGTFYSSKRVRPIFMEGSAEIVVVTVYTYFF